jgi:uncharacterized protein (TIGR00255 family)
MTGFGKSTIELPTKKITIEIKALNSKQIDIFTRIPPIYREKELEIRSILSHRLVRGKIDFSITKEDIGRDLPTKINLAEVENYKSQIEAIASTLNMETPADWFPVLLRLPDVIKTEITEVDDEEWGIVMKAISETIEKIQDFRSQEGEMLNKLLTSKIEKIGDLLLEIEPFEKERVEKIRSRISDNLQSIPDVHVDSNRLEQELIYYIEKLDINEEKTRLDNHLKYFVETQKKSSEQGKKLGFIAQEMGREINTLGSKSNQADMQKIVVQMKDELEQIKEQLLNVL